jgi:hypothetical protein
MRVLALKDQVIFTTCIISSPGQFIRSAQQEDLLKSFSLPYMEQSCSKDDDDGGIQYHFSK